MKRLVYLRKSKGMTQKDLANLLDISERAYQHYEAGTTEPPLAKIRKLASLFNVSIDYLVDESDNPKRH